jgi:hypothetical protein
MPILAQIPPPPQNLTVNAGLFGGAFLRWDTVGNPMGFVVYKSIDTSRFFRVAMIRQMNFLDWYVAQGYMYRYYVTAFNMDGESNPSDTVAFAVGHHHPPLPNQGVIRGKVTDGNTGSPLKDAVVRFYRPHKLWAEETHTDSGGKYWAALDTGRYLIRADKFGYFGEWFDNALHLDSATVVSLHQDTVNASFGLNPIPVHQKINVSGTVTDSLTGNPLPRTFIAFLRPHKWLRELQIVTGLFGGFPYERFDLPGLGRWHGVVWIGLTDSLGHYTAHLVGDLRYIAFAFKPGYVPEFYNNKYTPFDADRLYLTQDTSGIDFALEPNPNAIHSISGSVLDSTGVGIPSHVVLFRQTIFGRLPVRFTMTDSVGSFEFTYLVNGVFFLKAIPIEGYAPAWHSKIDCGVRNWRFADSIQVIGNIPGGPTDINVCVTPSPRMGFGRIAGNVDRNHGNLSAIIPEPAVTVYAVSTSTNQVVGYDVTETDGSYSIENVPEGTYNIVVDKEGYTTSTTPTATVDESNNYEATGQSVTLDPEPLSVNYTVNNLPAVYQLYPNYPNPFNPSTLIKFDLPKSSNVSLKVYNLLGQEVTVLMNSPLEAGTHSVRWNAQQNGTGIYFIKIVAKPVDGSSPVFSQVRKMVLMK